MGKKISELCNEYEAVSIINDRVDIACVSGADGVHLGQNDISPMDVEKITENQLLIGTSNALKEEIEISAKNKSTYIAIEVFSQQQLKQTLDLQVSNF